MHQKSLLALLFVASRIGCDACDNCEFETINTELDAEQFARAREVVGELPNDLCVELCEQANVDNMNTLRCQLETGMTLACSFGDEC